MTAPHPLSAAARETVLLTTRALARAGGGLDVALALDTTGTLGVYARELGRSAASVLSDVAGEVPGARLGAVCFKDHGPEGEDAHYLTLAQPFTSEPGELAAFLGSSRVAPGRGGGGAEAVECALRAARGLAWRPGASRALVLVGDKPPHGAGLDGLDGCPLGVDYRDEVEALALRGVRIYTVLVGGLLETRRVFEWMSEATGGRSVELRSAKDLAPVLVSTCLAAAGRGVEGHARRLANAGALTDSRREALGALAG